MKYLKKYKLFENLEIDLNELEDYLIDFKQMGLDWDVNIGSSYIFDWDKVNKHIENDVIRQCYLYSGDVLDYRKGIKGETININFKNYDHSPFSFNFNDLEEAYNMISNYLNNEYLLTPNYIYLNFYWNYLYFENFEAIKIWVYGGQYKGCFLKGKYRKNERIQAHRIVLGFK